MQSAVKNTVQIKVEEAIELPGAFLCEHAGFLSGSSKKGDVVLCVDCLDLLDEGAALVGDGFIVGPSLARGWVKRATDEQPTPEEAAQQLEMALITAFLVMPLDEVSAMFARNLFDHAAAYGQEVTARALAEAEGKALVNNAKAFIIN